MLTKRWTRMFIAGLLLTAASVSEAQDTPAGAKPPTTSQGATATDKKPTPRLVLSRDEWDFGQIWYGDECQTEIELKNAGDAPLKIIRVGSSCGCTVAKPKKKELAPGETDAMTVKYNSRKNAKRVYQTITIDTNDPVQPQVRLRVRGEVRHVFDAEPSAPAFGLIKPESRKTVTIELRNNLKEKVYPELVPVRPETRFEAELVEVEPGMRYKLIVGTKPPMKPGGNYAVAVVQTGVERLAQMTFRISALALKRVAVRPERIWVSPAQRSATTRTLRLYYHDDQALELTELKASNPKVGIRKLSGHVAPSKMSEFAAQQLQVTLPPFDELPDEGAFVEIYTDDPDPEFRKFVVPIQKRKPHQAVTGRVSRNPVRQVAPGPAPGPPKGSRPGKSGGKPE